MLRKFLSLLMLMGLVAFCEVRPGENLLVNGALESEQESLPPFWEYGSKEHIGYNGTAGPKSTGAWIIDNQGAEKARIIIRQHDLMLAEGGKYKFSVYVKTKDFKAEGHYGLIVHNSGWTKSSGITAFPENTDGWQFIEKEVTLFASRDNTYGIALYATKFTGHLEIAQPKFEAVSPDALANSKMSGNGAALRFPRLIPVSPVLYKIPSDAKKIEFMLGGKAVVGKDQAVFQLDHEAPVSMAVAKSFVLDLPTAALGEHTLKAQVISAENNDVLFERVFDICVVKAVKVDASAHKRLNNLVTLVLDEKVANDGTYRFSNPKDGWLYVGVRNYGEAAFTLKLDGEKLVDSATARHEAFRLATKGEHELAIAGAQAGTRIVVRAIANIFNYPLCCDSAVPQNGAYDWAFHEKYVFPAVTTVNGGKCPDECKPKLKEKGLVWVANLGTSRKKYAVLMDALKNANGLNMDCYDGVTCDEQFFSSNTLEDYTQAMWNFKAPANKLIYTWIVGKPGVKGLHSDFMAAAINASKGNGLLLYEAYCPAWSDEKKARDYLVLRLNNTIKAFNEFYPGAAAHSGMLLGNFNQIPVISLDVNPEVDYKYYLDMQLNILANSPDFANLNTVGYWGSYYDDEELYRWSFKLLRHYAVEGRTDMLSHDPKYNYKYNQGLLVNCDFDDGLNGWTVEAAAKDSVATKEVNAAYIRSSTGRWGSSSNGKHLCVLTRQEGQANTLRQVAKNLVPGRTYTLQFCAVDYDDHEAQKFNPYELPFKAILGKGVKVLPEKSYVFVDRRQSEKIKKAKCARINFHHIRFVAEADSVELTFTDEDAAPGKRYGFNYVMMKPYYDDEPIADEP